MYNIFYLCSVTKIHSASKMSTPATDVVFFTIKIYELLFSYHKNTVRQIKTKTQGLIKEQFKTIARNKKHNYTHIKEQSKNQSISINFTFIHTKTTYESIELNIINTEISKKQVSALHKLYFILQNINILRQSTNTKNRICM